MSKTANSLKIRNIFVAVSLDISEHFHEMLKCQIGLRNSFSCKL